MARPSAPSRGSTADRRARLNSPSAELARPDGVNGKLGRHGGRAEHGAGGGALADVGGQTSSVWVGLVRRELSKIGLK